MGTGQAKGHVRHDHDHDRRPPTTTTTTGPCSGSCQWTYSASAKAWSRASSSCGTGCACLAPTFCPATDACTSTACGHFGTDQAPPFCGGATTTSGACTTTTTAPGPGCTAGCTWYCHPTRGWLLKNNGCAGSCPCGAPATPCTGSCEETSTPCVPPPPPPRPYCAGGCRWVWVTPENYWYKLSDSCAGVGVPNCYCDRPAPDGTECAEEASTLCYVHGSPTGSPPCSAVTTTTGGPGSGCEGTCLWGSSSGASWDTILRACPACDCAPPVGAPTGTCSQAEGPCVPGVTTTTPGATTTTAGTCGNCTYQCNHTGIGYHYVSSACGAGCGCPDIVVDSACAPGSFRALACRTDGTTPGPTTTTTTTTPAPTTTTTTTSAGPPATTTTSGGGTTTPGGGGSTTTSGGGGTTTPGGPSYFCQTCENGSPNFCSGVIVCTVIGAHYTMIDCVANCQTPPGTSTFLT
ncbi:hypothetical protein VT84_24445 [Gemmata sp. SH-PL17]|uniref:hypothetical protein n=1 Tax=Gemmata sp. SH-PL17 TaxID=1630693 RepID=UPI00078D4AFD|nr:hypothetical protein [Gemmata sp. SH-PL17]AMV27574.1 hypothetical protein VT84_24445 [Gemmata sp. SH-PL17]